MKPIVPILGIASALWLFIGTWWMSSMVCTPNNATTFEVNDGKFNASSADMFAFSLSSEKMLYTKNTEAALQKIAAHLKDNPNKQLILTGLYGENETNDSSYGNLGIARAEFIKEMLVTNGAIESNIKATSLESDNLSFENFDGGRRMIGGVNFLFEGEEGGTAPVKEEEAPVSSDDNSDSTSEIESSPKSAAPGETMFLDITEANNNFTKTESFNEYFDGLKSYLQNNPDKKIILTCYNDDSALAGLISRKVKVEFGKLGLVGTTITRKVGKISESPNGIAGVNVEIQ